VFVAAVRRAQGDDPRVSAVADHPDVTDMPRRNGDGIALLADLTRRRIVVALAERPRRPSELACEIGLSRPAISRQLHLLRDAGLIGEGRSMLDGRVVLFYVQPRQLRRIFAWLAGTEIARPTETATDLASSPGAADGSA
jgi:DNA-binding transcriptional ArsR family regulator